MSQVEQRTTETDHTRNEWSVVCFKDGNEISTVPNKWIVKGDDDKIYCNWPSGTKSVSKKIQKAVSPEPEWNMYSVNILKEFATYHDAKNSEKKLEDTTDYTTTTEDILGRGHRKLKRKGDPDYVSSISPPPKIMVVDETSQEEETLNNDFVEEYIVNKENGDLIQVNDETRSEIIANSWSTVTATGSNNAGSNDEIILKMFQILIEMKETLRGIKTFIENIHTENYNVDRNITNPLPEEPFRKFRKIKEFEELLDSNNDVRNQMEAVFYLIGGTTIKENIRRGLKRMFSNKLATKCSLTGRGGKFSVKNLKLLSLLKVAVRRRFPELTDQYFDLQVQCFFKQAKLRLQRETMQ